MSKLDKLRALLAKETAEDWQVEYDKNDQANIYGASNYDWIAVLPHQCVASIEEKMQNRAALIVAMRNAIPVLLDVVEAAKRLTEANDMVLAMLVTPVMPSAFDVASEEQQESMRALRSALAKLEAK